MVTIKGGVLKGGTTKKKKHYMDDRLPQHMSATGAGPGSKRAGKPKKLEGALGPSKSTSSPKAVTKAKSKSTPKGPTNTPKAKPARSSKPMQASIPKAQGKAPRNNRETSISISKETAIGRGLSYLLSGPASRTDEERKKRARAIRASQK
jgi:hypothetical protein